MILLFSGPLKDTVEDFWRMVWEQRLPTIVMLTQLVEAAKVLNSTHELSTLVIIHNYITLIRQNAAAIGLIRSMRFFQCQLDL